ncbi:MAG TPA: hypothetical protein VK181_02605 [Rhizobium sp.]|nr:hypothetical protein [Rhizobium sp.]
MTVAVSATENSFSGNGVTTEFPTNIYATSSSQIKVYIRENGVDTLQIISSGYTLSDIGSPSGVTVIMLAPPTGTQEVVILRETPRAQELNLTSSRAYNPEVLMNTLDLLVMMIQEIGEQQERTFRVKPGITVPVELEDPTVLSNAIEYLVTALNDSTWIGSPLIAFLADDETVTGDWKFATKLTFEEATAADAVRQYVLSRTATAINRKLANLSGTGELDLERITHNSTGATAFELFLQNVVALTLNSAGLDLTGILSALGLKWDRAVTIADTTDLDTIVEGGFYHGNNTIVNRPDASTSSWYYLVMPFNSTNNIMQVAFRLASDNCQIAIRQRVGGVWGTWKTTGARDGSTVQSLTGIGVNFASVPIYATKVSVSIFDASADAARQLSMQLRAATVGNITTGYLTTSSQIAAAAASAAFGITDRIVLADLASLTDSYSGTITFTKVAGTTFWDVEAIGRIAAAQCRSWGRVDIGSTGITGCRIQLNGGAFDAGTFYVTWET